MKKLCSACGSNLKELSAGRFICVNCSHQEEPRPQEDDDTPILDIAAAAVVLEEIFDAPDTGSDFSGGDGGGFSGGGASGEW